jgi:hypothetical protein
LGILRGMARLWDDPADGETCSACDKPITKQQSTMEGIISTLGDKERVRFHIRCFEFVRRGEGRASKT